MPTPRQQIAALQAQLDATRAQLAEAQRQWRATAEERDRYAAKLVETQAALDAERNKPPPKPEPPPVDEPLIAVQAEVKRLEHSLWLARGGLRVAIAGETGEPMDVEEQDMRAREARWLEIEGTPEGMT